MKTILVTGAAGFIGAWTSEALLRRGYAVVGVDDFNDYYDVRLKRDRARHFLNGAELHEADIADLVSMEKIIGRKRIDVVCHLAAQAGVRYSLKNPFAYERANVLGTLNLLELARRKGIRSFIYASSSSVYGGNTKIPFSVEDPVDRPVSLYAATKKAVELMAHTYHHLYGIHATGLRFFTVYGPWGRPDMALFKFTRAILKGKTVDVYNRGKMKRDFTFITDIVDGVVSSIEKNYPHEIFNLGDSKPVDLIRFIGLIEKAVGRKAVKKFLPLQPGDVPVTYADIAASTKKLGFRPRVGVEEGVARFVSWYRDYYGV